MPFIIELNKEIFKFSGTHFTIFGSQTAERLHGHNYYVSVQLEVNHIDDKLGFAFDFNRVKPLVKALCDQWDEHVLIPETSPYLKFRRTDKSLCVQFSQKEYILPIDDVILLPIVNVTVEELARLIAQTLIQQIRKSEPDLLQHVQWLSIGVQETNGQRVIYREVF